ncbi:thiaminase II [Salicola sp. Rm-C-2C1-2]|uniref:thiaminase II n=1 Tax=Salicola sp. Rm-C-2C1-2 TaxID=3141321 RepID=UPI0032E3EBA2
MDLFNTLKQQCGEEWQAYINHSFPARLAEGSLPRSAFRHYLIQDYIFLKHFSRAWALVVYKADSISTMQSAVAVLDGLLNHEMAMHVEYCGQWGISREQIEQAQEARANMAYTRYVLDAGLSGDLLDLMTALAPCVLGYAEIGRNCADKAGGDIEHHPFGKWIETYSGDEFQALATNVQQLMNDLYAQEAQKERFNRLSRIFTDATKLEQAFWDMGLEVGGA